MPGEPEVLGLLALMLLHESRAATRFDGWGRLVRLADQDRTLWDRALIGEATRLLSRAMAMRRPGPYQIQAAIAAVHAAARRYPDTDWRQIRALYDRLLLFTPSPVVRLNRAVATRFVIGPQEALDEVEPLVGDPSATTGCSTPCGPTAGLPWPPRRGQLGERASACAGRQPGRT